MGKLLRGRAPWEMWAGGVLLAAYVVGVAYFHCCTPTYRRFSSAGSSYVRYEKVRVLAVDRESLHRDAVTGLELGAQVIRVRILTGEHKDEVVAVRNALSYSSNVKAEMGATLVACVDTADKNTYDVWIYSYDRAPFLYGLIGLFVATLCVVGSGRGIRSVLGIVFTFTGIVFLFIPLLYRGCSPASAAIGVVTVTLCVSLVLLGGIGPKTVSAMVGSIAGVAISGAVLACALRGMHLTGYSVAEADSLIQIAGATHMKVEELLFAAILISSLGAIMDVAISIASSVNEVFSGNEGLGTMALFNAGMNVGRDMMGTMANTLILAFTGTSLNLLILLYSMNVTYYQLVNNNLIGIYVVQAVSGSIAVVLTVPLVSAVAARLIPAMMGKESRRAARWDGSAPAILGEADAP